MKPGRHRSILLVEDNRAVAAMIAEMLEKADYRVDGPHATLADGMEALARHMPAGAVLDVRLKKGDVGLLADDLDLYDIPYLFCSGAPDHPVVTTHPAAPLIAKGAMASRLVEALDELLH